VINKIYINHPTIIENEDLAIENVHEKNVNILYFVQREKASGVDQNWFFFAPPRNTLQ